MQIAKLKRDAAELLQQVRAEAAARGPDPLTLMPWWQVEALRCYLQSYTADERFEREMGGEGTPMEYLSNALCPPLSADISVDEIQKLYARRLEQKPSDQLQKTFERLGR